MIGIYKITNKLNNKVYIGQSIHIQVRWNEHKRNAFNEKVHTYNYPIYKAIRKYGLENFDFAVLEEVEESKLTEREQYYIDQYDSLNPEKGYNLVPAIDAKKGENCNFSILTKKQVETIKNLLKNSSILLKEIGEMFQVSGSCIEDINKGRRWSQNNEEYPIRKNTKSMGHRGENQNTSILTELEVIEIRRRYVNEDINSIYFDFKNKISFAGFKKVCYGVTWKYLPCYKKREKKWIFLE